MSLIEIAVVVAIVGVIAGLGALAAGSLADEQRARKATRGVSDLMLLGRMEAIRTNTTHLLFFWMDASDNALQGSDGQPVAALLVRDDNGDGAPQGSEHVAALPFELAVDLQWGATYALDGGVVQAPNDNPLAAFPRSSDFECCSFTLPGGGGESRWIAFLPDGTPRGFTTGPFTAGAIGTGNGAVYLTNGTRDYAVVLSALGGVRTHAFDKGGRTWTE